MVLRRPETSATNGFFFNLFIMSSCLKNMYIMSSCLKTCTSCLNTIFAFLTLNTPRSAHNKIFVAKFLSFEQLVLTSSQPVYYTVNKQNTPKIAQQNQLVYVAKEPLLHCNRATVIMQNSLSCLPIVEVLECTKGCFA